MSDIEKTEHFKTFWKRSTMEIITYTEGTLADIIQLARKDILSLITTIESKDVIIDQQQTDLSIIYEAHDTLKQQLESQKEEIDNLKIDNERIYERVLEAIADQPDDYASYFAVLDIQAIIENRKEISK